MTDVFADSSTLSLSQAAQVLGVSLGTVRCWSDLGHLRSHRTQVGQLRFSRDDVRRFATAVDRRQVGVLGTRRAI